MTKRFILPVCISLCSFSATAQSLTGWGLKIGVHSSKMTTAGSPHYSKAGTGMSCGFYRRFGVTERLFLQSEFQYSYKTGRFVPSDEPLDHDWLEKRFFHEIEVPLLVGYTYGQCFGIAGLAPVYRVYAGGYRSDRMKDDRQTVRADVQLVAGGGCFIPLREASFTVDLRIGIGLAALFVINRDRSYESQKRRIRMNTISLNLGLPI